MKEEIIKKTNITYDEPHHGKLIAVVIVGILGIIATIYGAVSWGGSKVTSSVPNGAVSTAVATKTPAIVPTESFMITDTSAAKKAVTTGDKATTAKQVTSSSQSLPSAENFKSFSYDATVGKKISISGTCHDAYYALLIFESKDDYRANPGAARANRAYQCGSTKLFKIDMDLRDINLPSGSYYLFIADQGNKGSWYNPR